MYGAFVWARRALNSQKLRDFRPGQFAIFVNDTCGAQTNASCGSVSPGWGSNNKGNASNGLDPDVVMMGVARHKDRFFSHTLFYEQAAAGTLPAFSWISPKHEAADHPCLDLAKGERMLKDIYEALRGGKAWEKTLFVVTYDDYGGFCECGNDARSSSSERSRAASNTAFCPQTTTCRTLPRRMMTVRATSARASSLAHATRQAAA